MATTTTSVKNETPELNTKASAATQLKQLEALMKQDAAKVADLPKADLESVLRAVNNYLTAMPDNKKARADLKAFANKVNSQLQSQSHQTYRVTVEPDGRLSLSGIKPGDLPSGAPKNQTAIDLANSVITHESETAAARFENDINAVLHNNLAAHEGKPDFDKAYKTFQQHLQDLRTDAENLAKDPGKGTDKDFAIKILPVIDKFTSNSTELQAALQQLERDNKGNFAGETGAERKKKLADAVAESKASEAGAGSGSAGYEASRQKHNKEMAAINAAAAQRDILGELLKAMGMGGDDGPGTKSSATNQAKTGKGGKGGKATTPAKKGTSGAAQAPSPTPAPSSEASAPSPHTTTTSPASAPSASPSKTPSSSPSKSPSGSAGASPKATPSATPSSTPSSADINPPEFTEPQSSDTGVAGGGGNIAGAGAPLTTYDISNVDGLVLAVLLASYTESQARVQDLLKRVQDINSQKKDIRTQLAAARQKTVGEAAGSNTEADKNVQNLEDKLDSLGDDQQIFQIKLQNEIQLAQELISMMTNFLKNKHDTKMSESANFK